MEARKHGGINMRHGNKEKWRHEDMETWNFKKSNGKRKPRCFLILFTVCSSCKRKFVVFPFVDIETNGSYPFENGLNRLNGLVHLWFVRTRMLWMPKLWMQIPCGRHALGDYAWVTILQVPLPRGPVVCAIDEDIKSTH
jgi:hypothetical protein